MKSKNQNNKSKLKKDQNKKNKINKNIIAKNKEGATCVIEDGKSKRFWWFGIWQFRTVEARKDWSSQESYLNTSYNI